LFELATTYLAQGGLDAAQAAAEQSRDIIAKLAAADPGNAEWQRDLSLSWNKLGDMRVAWGDLAGALAAYGAAKDIRDRLVAADPGNAGLQRDLSVSWGRLGGVRRARGDLAGALAARGAAKDITERLAAADPGNAEWQRDLVASHWKLAELHERLPDRRHEARPHWSAALAVARDLAETGRLVPADAWIVAELERRLAAAAAP
jgi:tetratricopeptide (TPR) repeat protein